MKGLILAAGHGTRLRPLTYTTNKHLIPIANKLLIQYVIETLRDAGIIDIGIIVGHTDERVKEMKEALGDGSNFGVKFTYIFQEAPKGIAHAIKVAKDFLTTDNEDGQFVVHLGDNIVKGGIKKFVEDFKTKKPDAMLILKKVPNPQRFGVAEFKDGKLVRLVEKPKIPPSDYAAVGVYFYTDCIFDEIDKLKPSWRNEYEYAEAVQSLIDKGKFVDYKIIDSGWWKDPGDPAGILEVNHLILDELQPFNKGNVEDGATIVGRVAIEENTLIKKGSVIKGPVIIGKNSIIDSAYVGPYTSIGNNVVIKNAEIESSIVIDGVKIECDKRIIDSLIGKDATIVSNSYTPNAMRLILGEKSVINV